MPGSFSQLILLAISRTAIVGLIGLVAGGCAPYAYWSGHRRQVTAARAMAWPDALRCVIGALASGTSTLHASLVDLADAGPQPLRAPMARYARRSGQIGSLSALEAVRAELADPVSDQVLLTFAQAASEGTQTVLRTLELLLEQTNGDIALQDRVRTAGTQLRLASWIGFLAPLLVLLLFCTVSPQYRLFFSGTGGIVLVIVGTTLDALGLMVTRRLARTVPTAQRIFHRAGTRLMSGYVILAALGVAGAVGNLTWQVLNPRRPPERRMKPYFEVARSRLGGRVDSLPEPVLIGEAARRVLGPLARSVTSRFSRIVRTKSSGDIALQLRQAGANFDLHAYRTVQFVLDGRAPDRSRSGRSVPGFRVPRPGAASSGHPSWVSPHAGTPQVAQTPPSRAATQRPAHHRSNAGDENRQYQEPPCSAQRDHRDRDRPGSRRHQAGTAPGRQRLRRAGRL